MNKKLRKLAILIVLSAVVLSAAALAAGEMLPRSLVSGGGGRASGGGLALHNAIGQPAAGPVSNGTVHLCSGYWCGAAAPGSGAPTTYLPVVVKD